MSNTVLVVGMGTIGEPLLGLFDEVREELGIDEIVVYKHTARVEDRPQLAAWKRRGVRLCVGSDKAEGFRNLGLEPDYVGLDSAVERASVVVDATPEGVGLSNKERYYLQHPGKGYIAQGSEAGFGRPYVAWVNDEVVGPDDKFVHVLSCNTHCIASIIRTFAWDGDRPALDWGRFVCVRRSSDVGQDDGLVPGVRVNRHKGPWGTHHAKDVHQLFATMGHDLTLFSSALQVNTQYMHVLHFHLHLPKPITQSEAEERIAEDPGVSVTSKDMTNLVFSFGRDHSFRGRLLSQSVICRSALAIEGRDVVGYAFVPQDGNALLSNVIAVGNFLRPLSRQGRGDLLRRFILSEV